MTFPADQHHILRVCTYGFNVGRGSKLMESEKRSSPARRQNGEEVANGGYFIKARATSDLGGQLDGTFNA
jgi:hypothetical protein